MMLALGILIFTVPFLLTFLFEDRLRGFSCVCAFSTAFHLLVSLITQYLGIFTYPMVIGIHATALCGIIIAVFAAKRKHFGLQLNPIAIVAFCIVLFQLWTVHYNYEGTVNTVNGLAQVERSSYSYPLCSDEWIAAGLAKYSIREHSLPLVNPLDGDRPFPNLLMVFHSILAEFFLITGLDPVSQFAAAAILAGMAVCTSVFILLRTLRVDVRTASLAILLIPLISQAGYLLGLWSVLPYTLGLIFLVLGLSGLARDDMALAICASILSFAFYPPIIIFLGSAYLVYFRRNIKALITITSAISIPIIFSDTIYSKIFRPNSEGGMMSYPFWHMLPIIALPFVAVGLYEIYKLRQYFVLAPLAVGTLFWTLYLFYPDVIIIEFGRVVIITCVLMVTVAGVGLNRFKGTLSRTPIVIGMLSIYAILSLSYPWVDAWKHVEIRVFDERVTGPIQSPPSIQRHLTTDDLSLFAGIEGARFIAPTWKGLVLGVATDNDPMESKPSTITTRIVPYAKFMKARCASKSAYVRKYDVSFVYSAHIECPGFVQIGKSAEGLRLYKVETTE